MVLNVKKFNLNVDITDFIYLCQEVILNMLVSSTIE